MGKNGTCLPTIILDNFLSYMKMVWKLSLFYKIEIWPSDWCDNILKWARPSPLFDVHSRDYSI